MMGYNNANIVLPLDLIQAIQQYFDGDSLYIPRKDENRLKWGEKSNSKAPLLVRNKEIIQKYRQGIPVNRLADSYYLSSKSIYKIIAQNK